MRLRSEADLDSLVDAAIPEGQRLEYKKELHLEQRVQRREALKDLTGMANGGGGTVVFGIGETDQAPPVAGEVSPLEDAALVGRLEDIVQAGTSPPLLVEYSPVPCAAGGFVLVVDVERSPLGPVMVEGYGEARYFSRTGSRTAPMNEQQVRDAYALALRASEHRPRIWTEHHLPMAAGDYEGAWCIVSALPQEPLHEIFDPGRLTPEDMVPTDGPAAAHLNMWGIDSTARRMLRWAQGFAGDDRARPDFHPTSLLRLHRDGAAGLGVGLGPRLSTHIVARAAHAHLLYLAWFWSTFDLRGPAEIDVALVRLDDVTLDYGHMFGDERLVTQPEGLSVPEVRMRAEVQPGALAQARPRHLLVRQFTDRVHHAFGLFNSSAMFTAGQLYGADGWAEHSLTEGALWTAQPAQCAWRYTDGSVRRVHDSHLIGWAGEGVLTDIDGDTVAVVELATGPALPADYVARQLTQDPRARVLGDGVKTAQQPPFDEQPPDPSGRWSSTTLAELLDVRATPPPS
ncbi:MAG: ATP-binding protein [Acidimicrobiales bacterium]|nr:ATP-binding protein [Acidimicrobiales bacterium]